MTQQPIKLAWILGATLFVSGIFFFLVGRTSLSPTNTQWMIGSTKDLTMHYIGWEFYRNEPFSFPVGRIENYGYPFGTNIVFTDSIPLAAVFFKLFQPWLPEQFQYFGIWFLLCCFLQAFFAILILRRYTNNLLALAICSVFFLISPNLLYRIFGHIALGSHWLILWALYLILKHTPENEREPSWQWYLLFWLASWIHLYFLPMMLLLYLVHLANLAWNGAKKIMLFKSLILSAVTILASNWVMGSIGSHKIDFNIGGLGEYFMNLNALIDPWNFSSLIGWMPFVTPGQVDGVNYLGVGFFLLMGISLILWARQKFQWTLTSRKVSLLVAAFIFSAVALGNRVTFMDNVLFVVPLPSLLEKLLSIFRATGRFFWPVYYMIFITIFSYFLSQAKGKWATAILTLLLCIQIIDLKPVIAQPSIHPAFIYEHPLKNEFWQIVPKYIDNLIFQPILYMPVINVYEPIASLAAENGLTLNFGHLARWPVKQTEAYSQDKWGDFIDGEGNTEDLFIIVDVSALENLPRDKDIVLLSVDGYLLALYGRNEIFIEWKDWKDYSIPY